MHTTLLVTIIMAVYNRQDTIARALSSLRSQRYKNIQLIVVDGASDDDTVLNAQPFLTDRDVLVSEEDKGLYDALNKGLRLADGDVVGFLHSDDVLPSSDVLEEVVKRFNEYDVSMVYGDAGFFSGSDPKVLKRYYRSGLFCLRRLAWGHMPAHPTVYLRRAIYSQIGYFDDTYKIAADYEFLVRLAKNEIKYQYIKRPLILMQTGGLSTGGFNSTVRLNREVKKGLEMNGVYTNWLMLLTKYIIKLRHVVFK